jgi:hypothetical protein
MEKIGIKNTKEALILLFTIAEVIKEAKSNNGKIDMLDLPLFMKVLPVLSPALNDAGQIVKELKDLDSQESKELQDEILLKFGKLVEKEKLVEQVGLGLKAAVSVFTFIQSLK